MTPNRNLAHTTQGNLTLDSPHCYSINTVLLSPLGDGATREEGEKSRETSRDSQGHVRREKRRGMEASACYYHV
jgi:hypothetical protein